MASAESGDALDGTEVKAILLDAGGVLVFPRPGHVTPALRAAGLDPDLATLERAHYLAMAAQDAEAEPPAPGTWWHNYLVTYIAACGAPARQAERLAAEIAELPRTRTWAYAGLGVKEGLQALAALGLPLGIVSNSDGSVEGDLLREGICYAPSTDQAAEADQAAEGVPIGIIVDSAVVGVAKPDPRIFAFALDALGVPADGTVLHVGDSLRYDVAGALAAGLRPVHMDPHDLCPQPDGHLHVRSLAALTELVSSQR